MSLKYYLNHYEDVLVIPLHRLQIRELHCICDSCLYCVGNSLDPGDGSILCKKQQKRVDIFSKKKNSRGLKIRKHFCMFYKRDYLKPRISNESLKHSNLLRALKKAFEKNSIPQKPAGTIDNNIENEIKIPKYWDMHKRRRKRK